MQNSVQSTLARRFTVGGFIVAALALAACSTDRVAGPSDTLAHPSFARGGGADVGGRGGRGESDAVPGTGQALLRETPLAAPITRSITLTAKGGTLEIPEAGMRLEIPKEAIGNRTLTISATALEGSAVAYTFEPHGTAFLAAITLRQELKGTNYRNDLSRLLTGGYFADEAQVDKHTGRARLDDKFGIWFNRNHAYVDIWHFSGYMVSMD